MRRTAGLISLVLSVTLSASLHATTYGSVEPIANPAVIDTTPLANQPLRVREAFARGLFQCGIVDRVLDVLTSTGAIKSINPLNAHFAVGAGGFAGRTNPSFVFTILDEGPNGASHTDISIVTDSLGYVMSQASGFLLDANDPSSFDFPANYVVINFPTPPPLRASAALFRTVGEIDPLLFETDTSGYTQFGRAYLSLQSAVPDAAVHCRLCGRGGPTGFGVHAHRQRHAFVVSRRRGLSWKRLDVQHWGSGLPVADSGAEPSRARASSRVPPQGHSGCAETARAFGQGL